MPPGSHPDADQSRRLQVPGQLVVVGPPPNMPCPWHPAMVPTHSQITVQSVEDIWLAARTCLQTTEGMCGVWGGFSIAVFMVAAPHLGKPFPLEICLSLSPKILSEKPSSLGSHPNSQD